MRPILVLCLATSLQAALITSQPAGTTTVLSTVSGTWASSPSTSAGGFTVFGDLVWYGDSSYGLNDNGSWSGFAWVGGYCDVGGTDCAATIDLGGLYGTVGGFMNYAVSGGSYAAGVGGSAPIISAIAADGTTVLESYDLFALAPISTPAGLNEGAFRGISRGTADIAFLRIEGAYLIMHDLTLADPSQVPEPASAALLGLGLGAIAAFRHMRRR